MEDLYLEASDPGTTPSRLMQLAVESPELWEAVALNPSCDEITREWLFAQRPELRAAWDTAGVDAWPAGAGAAGAAGAAGMTGAGGSAARTVSPTPQKKRPVPMGAAIGVLTAVIVLVGSGLVVWGAGRGDDPSPQAGLNASTSPSGTDAGESSPSGAHTDAPDLRSARPMVIQSPSKNIGCELGDDYVGCSITERDTAKVGCAGERNASVAVYGDSGASMYCGSSYLGSPGDSVITLEYGESITSGDFSCMSESTGMTCWSLNTGSGFIISRNGVTGV